MYCPAGLGRAFKIEAQGLLTATEAFSEAIRTQRSLDHILLLHLPHQAAGGSMDPLASSDTDHINWRLRARLISVGEVDGISSAPLPRPGGEWLGGCGDELFGGEQLGGCGEALDVGIMSQSPLDELFSPSSAAVAYPSIFFLPSSTFRLTLEDPFFSAPLNSLSAHLVLRTFSA